MALMSIGKFAKEVGLTVYHVRRLHKEGKLIPDVVTESGSRYYSTEQLEKYLNRNKKIKNDSTKNIILYARVSTKNQKDDLERQIEALKQYAYNKGYSFEIITDIGSGINYKKEGLKRLIELVNKKEVNKIVILYKDRLVGFGFELIEHICNLNDVEIEIIDNTSTSKEQELTDDLIQIITVFANRIYGQRSKKTKDLIEKVKENANNDPE